MIGDSYYNYQAQARGLNSIGDVDALLEHLTPVYRRLLLPWLPRDPGAAIYEVACGPGIMLRFLKNAGFHNASGSDFSSCQIDLAREAGLRVELGDSLRALKQFSAASLDCVVAIDFIEHLPKDVLTEFFAESHRVLKPGGCLILRAPNGDSPFVGRNLFNDITHVWAYTTVALRALLQMSGFAQVNFADESLAMLRQFRWIKVPLMKLAQAALRAAIRMATREDVRFLNPSIFVCARK